MIRRARLAVSAGLLVLASASLPLRSAGAADAPPRAAARGQQVRVSVLRLRSFVSKPEDLAALSNLLTARLAAAEGVSLVDPIAPLVEKGADDWLLADKLLYDGIQDYGALKLDDAIRKLREAAALSDASFREYADTQGARRVREAALYLGLAHLEQGDSREAENWFKRAALSDPTFIPDPRSYPPAARAAYAKVRDGMSGPAYQGSREMLDPMAAAIGADVLVGGGIRRTDTGRDVLEVVVCDRWKGRLSVETVVPTGPTLDELAAALDGAMPRLIATVLDRPWDNGTVRRRLRKGTVGYAMGAFNGVAIDGKVGQQVFNYDGSFVLHGVSLGFVPVERGPWSLATDLSFFAPTNLPRDGFVKPSSAQGRVLFAVSGSARGVYTLPLGAWGASAGAGVVLNEISGAFAAPTFRSPQHQLPVNEFWPAPLVTLGVSRTVGARGFLQVDVGGEYDALVGPAGWSIRSRAAGGMNF